MVTLVAVKIRIIRTALPRIVVIVREAPRLSKLICNLQIISPAEKHGLLSFTEILIVCDSVITDELGIMSKIIQHMRHSERLSGTNLQN